MHVRGACKKDLNNFEPRLGLRGRFIRSSCSAAASGSQHSDLFTNGLNQNFEEYQATASLAGTSRRSNYLFRLSQGSPSYRFNVAADGSVPYVGTNYSGRNASWYDPNMRLPYVLHLAGGFSIRLSNYSVGRSPISGLGGCRTAEQLEHECRAADVSSDPAPSTTNIFRTIRISSHTRSSATSTITPITDTAPITDGTWRSGKALLSRDNA